MQALPKVTEHPMPPRTKATAYHRRATILGSIFGVSFTALPASISPTSQELAQPPHKSSLPRSARM